METNINTNISDLEEASKNHAVERFRTTRDEFLAEKCKWSFKAGAQWQKEQFEKNRLAACDRQTEEEAEIEQSFVMGIIENEHRYPTFDDAIKYGIRLKEQQMMANAVEGVVHHFEKCKVASVHYNDPTGVPMAYFTFPEGLSAGDKVKIIVIKED